MRSEASILIATSKRNGIDRDRSTSGTFPLPQVFPWIMNSTPRFLLRGCIRHSQKQSIPSRHVFRRSFNLLRREKSEPESEEPKIVHPLDQNSKKLLLAQDNLFHPLINSPILTIRKRAMAIKSLALCPTSGLLEGNEFTCPNCGFPTHCSEEHYKLDQERHEKESCDTLRMINEDLHDIQSGRQFPEFTLKRTPFGDVVNRRTTIDRKSVELVRLGSYTVHTVNGDGALTKVITTFNQPSHISLHYRRRTT
jgi:alkylhydroperoxidase/carboxymuconolactone decarboxylase family protein YurZ